MTGRCGASPHADAHLMKPPQDKHLTPLPEPTKPRPDPEKAIQNWEGEGGKVAPAVDPRRGRREPEGRSK
jgi:hypothetical protein